MALNKNKLTSDLKQLQKEIEDSLRPENSAAPNNANAWLEGLATIIEEYVKSATVTVTIPTGGCAVVGSPSAQTNAAPIIITSDTNIPSGGGLT